MLEFIGAKVPKKLLIMVYLCHCKQGEKIDCYIPYCTSNFGVQGGRDATLFFFYVSEVPQLGAAIYQNALQSSAYRKGDKYLI